MYFNGPPHSGKTQKLVDIYINLINSKVDVSSILVICSTANRKKDFIERVKQNLFGGYSNFKVYTFHGIVYNTVKDNWPLIEALIEQYFNGKSQILPHLSGLESCEFLLKECIKEQNMKKSSDLNFEDFHGGRSLVTQLIRRYRLMTENQLDFPELLKRSEAVGQTFAIPANESLKLLKKMTYKLRILDFVSQMNAFSHLITKEKVVIEHFSNVQHLLVDDIDESSPACQNFIKLILPNLETFAMSFDENGGTRKGYLGAYPDGWKEIAQLKPADIVKLPSIVPLADLAEKLFTSIKTQKPALLNKLSLKTQVNRVEMLDELENVLDELIFTHQTDVEEIIIITPTLDSAIKTTIQDYCQKNGIKWQFLTGSNKPIDNPRVYGSIILTQLINPQWKLEPTPFDVRMMLMGVLDFPPLVAEKVAQEYEKRYKDLPFLPNILLTDIKEEFNIQYQHLLTLIENLKTKELTLYEQLVTIFADIIAPILTEDESVEDINKILDSLKDFLILIDKHNSNFCTRISERDWLLQVKNEHVADNPVVPTDLVAEALTVATPQKIVDMERTSDYQIWLDVSSNGWTRTQTAALYNAWAYSNYFDGTNYDDNVFTHNITAHVLRSLTYQCKERIIALASTLDARGTEQQGWLIKYLNNTTENTVPRQQPVLRDDQSPIIKYKGGTMVVTAVPGSGKTYVNVALIVKLIENGVDPENILVLTYMDSAAQTLIKRVKRIFPNLTVLPQISTIHGLAYKIIRDEDNLSRLNLPEDIDIADETVKPAIMSYLTQRSFTNRGFELVEITDREFNNKQRDFEMAISIAKSYKIKANDIVVSQSNKFDRDIKDFCEAYKTYTQELERRGLIDFDDQIRYAIELLETFPEVRQKYQQQYHYVIEDEAQDSTILQQKLLTMLTQGHKNYVRTGDINQAIMTTFTPVDVEGFKQFINQATTRVEMNKSQRCAKPIYDLANGLIDWSKTVPELQNAFLDVKIKPVENKNPGTTESVYANIFEDSTSEMNFAAKKFAQLKQKMPSSTFAVLVRSNDDAIAWTRFLDSCGFNCICFTDNFQQRKVFNIIHNYLKVLYKPYNNKYIKALYETMITADIIKNDTVSNEFIKNLGSPFVSFDITELPTSQLVQFYMDILYWLEYANLNPSELILKLSQELFSDPIDRSNGFILSIMAEKYRREQAEVHYNESFNQVSENSLELKQSKSFVGLPEILKFFGDMSKMKKVKGFKFFEKEESDDSRAGFVQIMTVHKAKGMEFDVVFVPHIWENRFSYCTILDNVFVKDVSKLELQLMELAGEKIEVEQFELKTKQNQIEESLRLLYVAITRAKKYLFLTSSTYANHNTEQNRAHKENPSRLMQYFLESQEKEQITTAGKP